MFEWSGYELPEFHPEFAAAYGGEPSYTFFADEEVALQKLLAGFQADLSHPCTANIRRWRDAGLIRPIDTSRIDRWNEIIPELFSPKGVVIDGENFFMPWDFGYSQVVYNASVITEGNPGIDVLVNPEYQRKVSMNSQFDVALAIGGVIAGNTNIFDPSDEEVAKLKEVWTELVRNSLFLWSDGTEISQAMASGEVIATYMWTSDVVALRAEGHDIRTINPTLPWLCGLCLNVDGPGSEDQAYAYLNAMLDPQGGKQLVEQYGYGHANSKTFELVDPAILKSYGLEDPKAVLADGLFFDEVPAEKRGALIELWNQVQVEAVQ